MPATSRSDFAVASERVFRLVEELVAELGHRVSATPEELHAAHALESRLETMGYAAEIQPFEIRYFDFARWSRSGGNNANITVQSPERLRFAGLPLTFSPSDATVSGPLLTLDLTASDEFPGDGLEGRVVHVLTGDLQLNDLRTMQGLQGHVDRLASAGAVAIVFSRKLGQPSPYMPLFGVESHIPAIVIRKWEGWQLYDLATREGDLTVTVTMDVEQRESRNVIAELEGPGDELVIVGAHYDIVPATEAGANDNTSGTAVVLSLAEALAEERLPFSVRFVLFGAEELGLFGSTHYLSSLDEQELGRVRAMLNFDVVGTGPKLSFYGNEELVDQSLALSATLGVDAQEGSLPWGASSDHTPFQQAGIPVMLFFGSDISRIHSPEDRLEFVQPELLGGAFLVAHTLLLSPELIRLNHGLGVEHR